MIQLKVQTFQSHYKTHPQVLYYLTVSPIKRIYPYVYAKTGYLNNSDLNFSNYPLSFSYKLRSRYARQRWSHCFSNYLGFQNQNNSNKNNQQPHIKTYLLLTLISKIFITIFPFLRSGSIARSLLIHGNIEALVNTLKALYKAIVMCSVMNSSKTFIDFT